MKRPGLALESAIVMLLCAAGASLSHLWKAGPLDLNIAMIALIVPAIATGLYLCVSICVPDLYAVGKLKLPITVTLPLIFGVMVFLSVTLMSRVGLSVTRMPDELGPITVWADRSVLISTMLAGFLCLTVLGALDRDREPTPPESSSS